MNASPLPNFLSSRLPWHADSLEWEKWRVVFNGGVEFRDRYLRRLSSRESNEDFNDRLATSPIPSDASDGILEIRNSIFQRLCDVVRRGGSKSYQDAVAGVAGGVDLRGSSMNLYLGEKIIDELLVMSKVGIFVDMPTVTGQTLADASSTRPYIYSYPVEDILNFTYSPPGHPSEFSSLLLRDTIETYDPTYGLQTGVTYEDRLLWINDAGFVMVQRFDDKGTAKHDPIQLELREIPFVLLDIKRSLMKPVADDNISLLNLASLDFNFATKANFPFYTEAKDTSAGHHLKRVATDGTAMAGGQGARQEDIRVGHTQGRYYSTDAKHPPAFIAPPTDPIEASMKLQERMEHRIRRKLHLAVQGLAVRNSAESKALDNMSLEAGLSHVGLVLQGGEAKIAQYWANYENPNKSQQMVALVTYPDQYSLKTDADRIKESRDLGELMFSLPSRKAKKEVASLIANKLFGGRVHPDRLREIQKEIEDAPYTTSDPETVAMAKEQGLAGDKTLSISLGYTEDEYLKGQEDHLERAKKLIEAQASATPLKNPASRGVDALDPNPNSPREEKEASRNTDLQLSTRRRTRGKGKRQRGTEN